MKMVTTVLAVLAAIVMAASGIFKIVGSAARNDMTNTYEIGGNAFPGWFFVLVGIAEVAIAIWLLYPPFRDSGGVALLMVMLGALIFNLFLVRDVLDPDLTDPSSFWIVNIVIGLIGAFIAYMWPRVDPVVANSQGWAYTDGSETLVPGAGRGAANVEQASVAADMSTRDMSTRDDGKGGRSPNQRSGGVNNLRDNPPGKRDMSTRQNKKKK